MLPKIEGRCRFLCEAIDCSADMTVHEPEVAFQFPITFRCPTRSDELSTYIERISWNLAKLVGNLDEKLPS